MPVAYTKRILMIVPVIDLARARQAAAAYDRGRADRTFSRPLSPTGLAPATHYAASTQMRPATARAVADLVARDFPLGLMMEYDMDNDDAVEMILAGLGLRRIDGTLP